MAPRSLTDGEKTLLGRYFPARDLDDAVLHEGRVPWYLSRRFTAIVRGRHIFVRTGLYDSGAVEGLALLAHELTHVRQYRHGMTALGYLWRSLRGYHRNPYEQEAFAVQARVLGDLRRLRSLVRCEQPAAGEQQRLEGTLPL